MDFNSVMTEAFSAGVIAPMVSLVILPIVYRLVGVSKRERREREQTALRMTMDLARGLKDLAEATSDPAARQQYQTMRAHVLRDFLGKARAHFDEERNLQAHPEARYWLLPKPRGLFGFLWSALAVILSGLFLMFTVGVIWGAATNPPDANVVLGLILFTLVLFVAPILLLRWFSFMSARIGLPKQVQSQSQR